MLLYHVCIPLSSSLRITSSEYPNSPRFLFLVSPLSPSCILAEMFLRVPLFGGNPATDAAQLERIYRVCGTPVGEALDRLSALPHWAVRKPTTPSGEPLELTSRLRDKCRPM